MDCRRRKRFPRLSPFSGTGCSPALSSPNGYLIYSRIFSNFCWRCPLPSAPECSASICLLSFRNRFADPQTARYPINGYRCLRTKGVFYAFITGGDHAPCAWSPLIQNGRIPIGIRPFHAENLQLIPNSGGYMATPSSFPSVPCRFSAMYTSSGTANGARMPKAEAGRYPNRG